MLRVYLRHIFLFLYAILPLNALRAAHVTLAWDANPEPDVAGYRVYYSTVSGSYANVIEVGSALSAELSDLQAGTTYYFAVTAYNTADLESPHSDELSYSVPSDPFFDNDKDGLPDQWESLHGLNTTAEGTFDDGRDGDPDRDGISNFLEYVLDSNPRLADPPALGAPQLMEDEMTGKRYITISVRRRTNDSRIVYQIQRSSDLSTWSAAQAEPIAPPVASSGGESETVTYRVLPAIDQNDAVFVRVAAAVPNPAQ